MGERERKKKFLKKKTECKALTGFEPVISCLLDRRFNQLSHRASSVELFLDCVLYESHYSSISGPRRRLLPVLVLVNCWNTLLLCNGSTRLRDARPYLRISGCTIQGRDEYYSNMMLFIEKVLYNFYIQKNGCALFLVYRLLFGLR